MIAILARTTQPNEELARAALEAAPYAVAEPRFRRLGSCLLGVAPQPGLDLGSISSDGPLIAVLDGRLDNAPDLRREFLPDGDERGSSTDADIVVAAFQKSGPKVVNRFRGVFAGAVSDGHTLWFFRDHVGFHAQFYHDDATQCVVANEARPVLVASGLSEEPHLEVIEAIYFGYQPGNIPTALKGVERIPQGVIATTGATVGVTLEKYWLPRDLLETGRYTHEEARERFLVLMRQAVERSITGNDVLLLSGGLDSPTVAAYGAPHHLRLSGRPLGALAVVFPDQPVVDERHYIELVAKRHGLPLHTYSTNARTLDDVEQWSQKLATPVPTLSIPEVWEAYDTARKLGYRNVLTGEFAELTYGKYPHQLAHLLWQGRLGAMLDVMRAEHALGTKWRYLWRSVATAFVPGRAINWYLAMRGQNAMHLVPPWLERIRYNPYVSRDDFMLPARERWRTLQMYGTAGSTITMEADALTAHMAGVNIRRPFADVDLWEFFLSLRAEIKFPVLKWKALARSALRGVIPDEILDRRDKTFFDDHVMRQVDYATLERLLVKPQHRLKGINYDVLADRIAQRDMTFPEWLRARELAKIHAYLSAF